MPEQKGPKIRNSVRAYLARLAILLPFAFPAYAEPVQIAGPNGPLEAEAIAVDGAAHAVVIIPGSGPTDRDGNALPLGLHTDTYRLLAEALAGEGISSLRIDKRGLYGSRSAISNPNDVTIAAYAQDVRDWVDRAAELAPCVWLAGHSEGGLVALVAAQLPPENLCGLILMATSGRPIGQLMREQLQALPGNAAYMPAIDAMLGALEAGRTGDPSALPGALRTMFSPDIQPYMIDLFSYNPVTLARHWRGPVLIVQGDADIQVKRVDADLLATALPQAVRANLADATHMLKRDVPGQLFATYSDPTQPLHPYLVPVMITFFNHAAAEGKLATD